MKTEIFDCILQHVSNATEISKEEILGKTKTADIVEARAMIVHFGKRYGLSDRFLVAKLNRKSTFGIRYLASQFYSMQKSSFSFREAVLQAEQNIANILPKT